MLKITVIAIGKLKEKYLTDACNEYIKRLGAYSTLNIIVLPNCKINESEGASATAAAIEDEGDRILAKIPQRALIIPMCIEGKEMSSEELSEKIESASVEGYSEICFIIGGSYGLSDRVKALGRIKLSMSRMTFPHQLARVMLLEQIYRSFKIAEGGTYHK